MSPRCNFMSGTSDLTNVEQVLPALDFIMKREIERTTTPKHVREKLEKDTPSNLRSSDERVRTVTVTI